MKCTLFESTVRSVYPTLSSREKLIADYLFVNEDILLEGTTKILAEQTKASTATVVRFCRKCGFDGFSDLKHSYKKEYMALKGTSNIMTAKTEDSFSVLKDKSIGYNHFLVSKCLNECEFKNFDAATEAILNAKQIIISGEGGGKAPMIHLYDLLLQMGFPCHIYFDSVFEIVNIGKLQPDDLLITFSYTGRLQTALDAIQLARKKGIKTLTLTGYKDTLMALHSDIILSTNSFDTEFFSSSISARITEMAIVNLLAEFLMKWSSHSIEGTGNTTVNPYIEVRRIKE